MALPLGDGFASVGSVGEVTTLATNTNQTLSPISRAIYFSTDGTFQFTPAFQTTSVTITVYGGDFLPLRVKTVHASPAGSIAAW